MNDGRRRATRTDASPDSARLADDASTWCSAYVHIPFCARVCPYCDFAVVAGRDDLVDRYLAGVQAEIAGSPPWRELDAVFVGGGTPSRIDPAGLKDVIEALEARLGIAPDAEVTIEANPEDWTADRAAALRAAGFTRVSFGAQSFESGVLAALGRRHTAEQVDAAVADARTGGFESVSVDLIYGTPGETVSSWLAGVQRAVGLGVDHVSAYALTVERGTELSRQVTAGKSAAPDPDLQAACWEGAQEILAAAGYLRYEVSNSARAGHHCRYNLSVWGQGEYLGFGAGAHGFRDGIRSRNVRRIERYIERVEAGIGAVQGTDVVAGWDAEIERVMLGLRRSAGVIAGPAGRLLIESEPGRRLIGAGVVDLRGERLVVTRPLLTDEVSRAILALEPPVLSLSPRDC